MPDDNSARLGVLKGEIYFPTYIFFRDFPDAEDLNQGVRDGIYAWMEQDQEGITRSNAKRAGSWHSSLDMHERPEFKELAARISDTVAEIFQTCGYDPDSRAVMDNMWANVNPPGGYNRSHIHPRALWSGVYYVQAPPEAGQIVFIDPRTAHLMYHPRYDPSRKRDAGHWTEVFFAPQAGRLILFPSWLYHEVEANLAEGDGKEADRISVSFNFYQSS